MIVVVLILHAGLLAWNGLRYSPTFDEIGHLPAGLSHWEFGRFDLYSVNPPLVRSAAALPVMLAGYDCQWATVPRHGRRRPEFSLGRHFIARNGERSFFLFALARWACIPFSLLGAWVCWRWASELYGPDAGSVALSLWSFSPMVLGFGSLIVPDVGSAALGVAASYAFWCWLQRPVFPRAYSAGLLLGVAFLTKFTLVIFYLLWPLLWFAWLVPIRRQQAGDVARQAGQLAMMSLISVLVINTGYLFDGTMRRLDTYEFVSRGLSGGAAGAPPAAGNRFAGTAVGRIPVPLPADVLHGIDRQWSDFDRTMPSYLRGQWRDGGWYHYYIYGLLVKEPLGTWVLVVLAVFVGVFGSGYTRPWRDEIALLVPALGILLLVSSQTGFNHHLRYVLPVFPFVFIWVSKVARSVAMRERTVAVIAGSALVWAVASSLWYYPHSLSYFNELAGGPKGGHHHLGNSNIDWGQDLLNLRRWLARHPEVALASLEHSMPFFDVSLAGIRAPRRPAPRAPEPGWHAISVNRIQARDGHLRYFLRFEPAAAVGYSIYIYHLTVEEANRVRAELGLPKLECTADGGRPVPGPADGAGGQPGLGARETVEAATWAKTSL